MPAVAAPPASAQRYSQLEQVERRCREDFPYAAATFLQIKPKEEPLTLLRLNWPQQYVYDTYLKPAWERREPLALILLKARREGMSTLFAAYLYHKARWWRGQNCYQTAHDDDTVQELFDMVLRFHDNLPEGLQPPTRHRTQTEIEYAAPWDSHVRSRVAKYLDIGRGKTIHHAHLSEVAFYPDPETIFGGMLDAVPVQGPTSMVVETTANGADTWFEEVWNQVSLRRGRGDVLGGRHWQAVFLPWFWNPWNVAEVGREFQLEAEERALQQAFQLRVEQLAWRRNRLAEFELLHPGQGARLFRQENPACLVAGTRISTARGMIPIDEARQGDATESGLVVACGPQPRAEVYTLVTERGRVLTGTGDHPIRLASDAWRGLGNLRPGEVLQLCPPRFATQQAVVRWQPIPGMTSQVDVTDEWALLMGYFLGEGNWYKTECSIACDPQDTDVISEVSELLAALVGPPKHTLQARVQGRRGCLYVAARASVNQQSIVREVFVRLGLVTKNASANLLKHLRVPDSIWRSPREQVRLFLSALFACDGSLSGGIVRFYTKSADFARDLQLLLLGFGMNVRLVPVQQTAGNGKTSTGTELAFGRENTTIFCQEIGFRSLRKQAQVPGPGPGTGRPPQPVTLTDVVQTVTRTGTEVVTYDLTVKETHRFAANGILTHNTAQEAFLMSGQCVFAEDGMERLKTQQRPPTLGFQIVRMGQWRQALVREPDVAEAPMQVWEPPLRGYQYCLGVDVSRGTGRDDSAVVVLRMPEFVQVALWYDNFTAPKQLAYTVAAIARYYGMGSNTLPICTVEINDAGILVNSELETMRGIEPLDIYVWEYFDKVGQQMTTKTGWMTTWATKNILIGMANSLLVANMVRVPSAVLQQDMARTVEVKPTVYRTGGCDLTIAWLLALVTAWRKIARWDWLSETAGGPPVVPYPEERRAEDPGAGFYRDPVLYDGRWQRVLQTNRDLFGAGLSGW